MVEAAGQGLDVGVVEGINDQAAGPCTGSGSRRVLPDTSLSAGTLPLDDWGSEFGVRQTRTIGGTSPHAGPHRLRP